MELPIAIDVYQNHMELTTIKLSPDISFYPYMKFTFFPGGLEGGLAIFFLYKGENAIFEYFWPQGGTYPL